MRALSVVIGGSLLLAACGQAADNENNQVAAAPPAPKKQAAYCFFKPEEMKAWTATRATNGNITVKGKAHVKDPRYQASFGQVATGPKKVIVYLTIAPNGTGYAAPDDTWSLSETVPDSASVNEAVVQCGDKVIADLQISPKS